MDSVTRPVSSVLNPMLGLAMLLLACSPAHTAPVEWEDQQVVGRHKEPGRTHALPYADRATAREALRQHNPWVRELGGDWKFHWAADPGQRRSTSFDPTSTMRPGRPFRYPATGRCTAMACRCMSISSIRSAPIPHG